VQADNASATQQGPANVARIIYFDYDSYVIKPDFQQLIEAHARFLKSNGKRHIVIEGHTDERGGREYNLALGQRRSEAVRRSLGLLGVPDSQIEAVSFGKEKPTAPGSDEASWAKNRRAEIVYR
jgi:peptidoglycan-associated lipoprotein